MKSQEYEKIKKAIIGGLNDCINTHGPINKKDIASATKRIYGIIKTIIKQSGDK